MDKDLFLVNRVGKRERALFCIAEKVGKKVVGWIWVEQPRVAYGFVDSTNTKMAESKVSNFISFEDVGANQRTAF